MRGRAVQPMAPCGGTLRLYPVEAPPVELDAVTRAVRRDCATIIDPKGLRNVALESEPMSFEVTAVRLRLQRENPATRRAFAAGNFLRFGSSTRVERQPNTERFLACCSFGPF
jgi:hypothetical protein